MIKNMQLQAWLWKWHFIAGLMVLPFILLLSVTGVIYLFKDNYEQMALRDMSTVTVPVKAERTAYEQQWQSAKTVGGNKINAMLLPSSEEQATVFSAGRFSGKSWVYVDPYNGQVTGNIAVADTFMQQVRNLHGELLLGDYGTKVVELVASWMVVLILTGLYIWWPKKVAGRSWLKGSLIIRRGQGKRIFWRDMHAVLGFWSSLVLLVILAGGMPWTDVFGSNYKSLRDATGTGYPVHWRNSKGLESKVTNQRLSLDAMVQIAQAQQLPGTVTLKLPLSDKAVFSVSNRADDLQQQQVLHFDQYSGHLVKALSWQEVGIMSSGRQIVMRLHQGQYFGIANWLIVLLAASALAVMSASALISYIMRKPAGKIGIPKVPSGFQVGKALLVGILVLALVLPLFGASLVLIVVLDALAKRIVSRAGPQAWSGN
ncbi:MAG: PepSY domain-containing protein [Gammaproteobacteria bacterium]|nr:PepSY domain-containing protein [Gammaproteobacteria bacterium]